MEFQTRDEIGDIRRFATFSEAYAHFAQSHPAVWKISWDDENRWRAKPRYERWLGDSEKRLQELSTDYANTPDNSSEIFWVQQKILPDNYEEIMARQDLSPGSKQMMTRLASIKAVLTDAEFVEKFKDLGRVQD